jgi:hypothetical protein
MTYRIGTGAGFSADRLDPALQLLQHGELDCIVFECVGERTLAFGHRDRRADPSRGYNPLLQRRLRQVLPLAKANGTRVVTNMGVANPLGAAEAAAQVARELGLSLRIAAVLGDDVSDRITPETPMVELGETVAGAGRPYLAANAYLGADAIIPAIEAGADLVITGRVADPSLFLAPLAQAHGWDLADWDRMAAGTVVGHLLECAAQVTGGYFADPGVKEVPRLAYVGFPLAEVATDGSAVVTKLAAAGGRVDLLTVKEQLLYEVHDPSAYVTPDVVADFAAVRPAEAGGDRVSVSGARGKPRPEQLKVTVAFDGGLLAEAEVSYGGLGAVGRARLAADIVAERMRHVHGHNGDLRCDLIGVSALHGTAHPPYPDDARDVRLRCALRADSREQAELLLWEVESLLCCGPAGGGGYRGQITPSVMTGSTFLDRDRVTPSIELIEVRP